MQLGKRALGIAFGTVWGCAIMFGTWFLLLLGASGQMFSRLSTFYIGYTTSIMGGIIGFVYGFVTGFIGGFLIAWIYNFVYKSLAKK
jgi:hypothetical protein